MVAMAEHEAAGILCGKRIDDSLPSQRENFDNLAKLAAAAAVACAANAIQMKRRRRRDQGLAIDATAAAVLEILSHDSWMAATEKTIRELIGNSSDTSKALRRLLKQKKIQRCGTGGRTSPFKYYSRI